jgi:hypothetical protein
MTSVGAPHDRKGIELALGVSGRRLVTECPCRLEPAFRDPGPGVEPLRGGQRRLRGLRQTQHLRPPPGLGRDARRLVHGIDVAGGEPAVLGPPDQALEDGFDLVVGRQQALQSSLYVGSDRRAIAGLAGDQSTTVELFDHATGVRDSGDLTERLDGNGSTSEHGERGQDAPRVEIEPAELRRKLRPARVADVRHGADRYTRFPTR